MLANIILVLLLAASIAGLNVKLADNTGILQREVGIDTALTVNAIKAAPHTVEAQININEKYDVTIDRKSCNIETITQEEGRAPTIARCSNAGLIQVQKDATALTITKEVSHE